VFRTELNSALANCAPGERGFAESITAVATKYSRQSPELIQVVSSAINTFHTHPIEFVAGAVEALGRLRAQCRLVVLTKGLVNEQESKLQRSGILEIVNEYHCVERKSVEALVDVMRDLRLASESTASFGNSVLHDVIPATELGVAAFWLNHFENQHGRNAKLPLSAVEIPDWSPICEALGVQREV